MEITNELDDEGSEVTPEVGGDDKEDSESDDKEDSEDGEDKES